MAIEETTKLLFFSTATAIIVGFVQSNCNSGDCIRREMCVDRPWAESRGEQNNERLRIVDAPLGSDIVFLCNYCGEMDKGQSRFWYTSHRYKCIILSSAITQLQTYATHVRNDKITNISVGISNPVVWLLKSLYRLWAHGESKIRNQESLNGINIFGIDLF